MDERPDATAVLVMEWLDSQPPLARWLAVWGPTDCYANGRVFVERSASDWIVTFSDGLSGSTRTVRIPIRGTPEPPRR